MPDVAVQVLQGAGRLRGGGSGPGSLCSKVRGRTRQVTELAVTRGLHQVVGNIEDWQPVQQDEGGV